MIHLCTGLTPIPGSMYSRACARRVRSALGRCELHRPAAERPEVDPDDRRRWNRAAKATRARAAAGAGLMEGL